MVHTIACAEARGPVCKCTGCGGSEHGWGGGLWSAAAYSDAMFAACASAIDRTWYRTFDEDKPISNRFNRCAAVAGGRLGVIRFLARNWASYRDQAPGQLIRPLKKTKTRTPADEDTRTSVLTKLAEKKGKQIDLPEETLIKAIDELGTKLVDTTMKAIDEAIVDEARRREVRRDLAKHFFCDLCVGFARALQQYESLLKRVPKRAARLIVRLTTKRIVGSEHHKTRDAVEGWLVEKAVEKGWTPIEQMIEQAFPAKKLILFFQILAILSCPALEKHSDVIKYCLVPLGNQVLEPVIKERLKNALSEKLVGELNPDEPTLVN